MDVQPYAFTTKSLFVGHLDHRYLRWQVIDTPGILDRPLEERNTIEMQVCSASSCCTPKGVYTHMHGKCSLQAVELQTGCMADVVHSIAQQPDGNVHAGHAWPPTTLCLCECCPARPAKLHAVLADGVPGHPRAPPHQPASWPCMLTRRPAEHHGPGAPASSGAVHRGHQRAVRVHHRAAGGPVPLHPPPVCQQAPAGGGQQDGHHRPGQPA